MSSIAVVRHLQRPAGERVSHLRAQLESSLDEHLSSTLLLRERAAPLTVPTGIPALDELTGGLPRGALSEFSGPTSSGRTGAMLSSLAGATRRNEVCALVDAGDSLDPASAAAAGVDLERLLWVRCNRETRNSTTTRPPKPSFPFSDVLEQVLKITDLLLQAGGFGMVVLDLGDIPAASVRRIPLTSWFRFRRAVEPTATVLLLIEQEACAKTCASLVLRFAPQAVRATNASAASVPETCKLHPVPLQKQVQLPANNVVSHAAVLRGMAFHAAIARSWNQRKPPQSVGADFQLSALSG